LFFNRKEKKHKVQQRVDIELLKKAFELSNDAVLVVSDEAEVLYANKKMRDFFSLPEKYTGKKLEYMPKIKVQKEWKKLDALIEEAGSKKSDQMFTVRHAELESKRRDCGDIPIDLYIDRVASEDGEDGVAMVFMQDLTQQKECREMLYRHKLTKLPNQLQAQEDLNRFFAQIHLHNKKLALLFIDIDNFSEIRSLVGSERSEQILIHFAEYLKHLTKESKSHVYHTFSNIFMICMPKVESLDEVHYLARQIQRELRSFYKINNIHFHLTASIGISIYPDSGSTLTLMDNGFKALSEAQKSGLGHINVYKKTELESKYDELTLFNEVHHAIDNGEFEVYYQPIVRAKDVEVVGAEALIRWKHRTHGYIPPDIFVPMLEKSGFVIDLGRYVLSEVLKQQKRWELFKFKPIEVSINMSLLELETEGFVENVAQQLAEHQVAPELIKFEITEGAAMQNESKADTQLHALKKLGVSIALDDFGTGYTSFAYLKKFPANILKIDKSMVDHILEKKEDQRIIRAMIELGHNLGMKIVVEGIESLEMADRLVAYGCDYMQGYYFSRPLPAYEFQEMIRR